MWKFTLEGSSVGGSFFRVLQHSQLSFAEIWKISVIPKKSLSNLVDLRDAFKNVLAKRAKISVFRPKIVVF